MTNELELKYGCNPNQKPARIFIKEPYTNQFSSLLGILLVIAEIPRKCKSGDALGSCSKTVSIQLIQFRVRLTVTADVG